MKVSPTAGRVLRRHRFLLSIFQQFFGYFSVLKSFKRITAVHFSGDGGLCAFLSSGRVVAVLLVLIRSAELGFLFKVCAKKVFNSILCTEFV